MEEQFISQIASLLQKLVSLYCYQKLKYDEKTKNIDRALSKIPITNNKDIIDAS